MRSEELYVMEHPSFRAILEQVEDILEAKDSDDINHTPDYVGILPKPDANDRETFDVRLVRFDGLSRVARSWYDDFRIEQIPVLAPRLAWLGEVPEVDIKTWLREALGKESEGQEFRLSESWSFRDLDQVIEAAYVKPLLEEMRASHHHKLYVKAVVRAFLEQRAFAVPAGLPLSFAAIPNAETGRVMVANLARPDVFRPVRAALAPVLKRLMSGDATIETAQLNERHAKDLEGYQALRRHLVDPSHKTVFVRAAHDSDPEARVTRALDRAVDVIGWLYNHRQGVGFGIQYDHRGRTHHYFPDFLARARLGNVVHNFILELKGRFDDRDRKKALRGRWYSEILTRYDREPWHYIVLIENKPEQREDLAWWESQSVVRIEDLLRRHESMPLYPDEVGSKVRIAKSVTPDEEYRVALPVLDLGVKAGPLPAARVAAPAAWAILAGTRTLDERMFVAKIEGKSMEPRVPAGSWGLFRGLDEGAGAGVALDRRRVLVEVRDAQVVENEGKYVLKRLLITKRRPDGGVEEVELRSDNPAFKPIVLRSGDAEIAVRAEFLEVLG